jgi:dolichol-phosphate hexosyltransferase
MKPHKTTTLETKKMHTQTATEFSDAPELQFKIQQAPPISKEQLTIVIPVKNEELAIRSVIDELLNEGYSNILVVDGYSIDKTLQIIREKKEITIIQQHGKGKTGAIKTAIENVNTPYLLILDGDYTYQAHDIQRLLNHCANYAQVIGVRDRKNISLIHRFGNGVITKAFNLLMGTNLSDICSGMYLLKTEVAKNIELGSKNFATEVEIAAQTIADYQVTEVPIGYRPRLGKPKLSWRNGFEILSSVFSLARKYNPLLLFSAFSLLSIIPAVAILVLAVFCQLTLGVWHSGWALMGVMLLLFAFQALAVGSMVLLMKRIEKRLLHQIKKNGKDVFA